MSDDQATEDKVMGFRPTERLRKRLDLALSYVGAKLDMRKVSYQLELTWLLNSAMDALGVPQPPANGDE